MIVAAHIVPRPDLGVDFDAKLMVVDVVRLTLVPVGPADSDTDTVIGEAVPSSLNH